MFEVELMELRESKNGFAEGIVLESKKSQDSD